MSNFILAAFLQVESFLPITVDAVNDPPKVIVPRHLVMKFGAFDIWSRYLATQAERSEARDYITLQISTDGVSGRVLLHGNEAVNNALEVKL